MDQSYLRMMMKVRHLDHPYSMINPGLNVTKSFREQVENFMYTTFGKITQPFIKATLAKNNTSVLVLILFMRK